MQPQLARNSGASLRRTDSIRPPRHCEHGKFQYAHTATLHTDFSSTIISVTLFSTYHNALKSVRTNQIRLQVFHDKLQALLHNIRNNVYFPENTVIYMMHVIEYQHRGMPHAHIVVKLDKIPGTRAPARPLIICQQITPLYTNMRMSRRERKRLRLMD